MSENEITAAIEKAFSKERIGNRDRRFVHPPYVLESRLRDFIVAGDFESARSVLKEINANERAKLAGDRLRSLKNSLIASCTIYTRAAIDGGVDAELAFTMSDTFIRRVEATLEEESLAGLELGMVREFAQLVRRYRDSSRDILVTRALRAAHVGIMEAISLREIARNLGVSEQYLSSHFAQKMGTPFSAYVRRMKVEEAKIFLRSTDLEIMEIAENLGFSRQSYFSRVFKEIEGMTPSEYRRQNYAVATPASVAGAPTPP